MTCLVGWRRVSFDLRHSASIRNRDAGDPRLIPAYEHLKMDQMIGNDALGNRAAKRAAGSGSGGGIAFALAGCYSFNKVNRWCS